MNQIEEKEGITDARELGMPKYIILGVQHLFAMFGATVLVPVLTGLSVSSTLLFAGIGTLVFHLVSKFQVPDFRRIIVSPDNIEIFVIRRINRYGLFAAARLSRRIFDKRCPLRLICRFGSIDRGKHSHTAG